MTNALFSTFIVVASSMPSRVVQRADVSIRDKPTRERSRRRARDWRRCRITNEETRGDALLDGGALRDPPAVARRLRRVLRTEDREQRRVRRACAA